MERLVTARELKSTVNTAVLCLVLQQPGNGYEIGRRFVTRYGAFFRSTQRHIYTSLERLEEQGLIEAMPGVSGERPGEMSGPGFRATAAGARAFKAYLAGPVGGEAQFSGAWIATVDPGEIRRELIVRWISIRPDDFQTMLELLGRYEEIVLRMAVRPPVQLAEIADQLAVEERELAIQGLLRWIMLARERVSARADARPR